MTTPGSATSSAFLIGTVIQSVLTPSDVEVARVDLRRHPGPVPPLVGRRRRRVRDGAVVRGVPVVESIDEDEVDDGVAPVEDAGGGRARLAALKVVGARDRRLEVVHGAGVVRRRRGRGARHPGRPVDEELVLDRLPPGDLDGGGPRRANVGHRRAGDPGAGRVAAAELDARLAVERVRERLAARLQRVGAVGRSRVERLRGLPARASAGAIATSARARGRIAEAWLRLLAVARVVPRISPAAGGPGAGRRAPLRPTRGRRLLRWSDGTCEPSRVTARPSRRRSPPGRGAGATMARLPRLSTQVRVTAGAR